ncbi:MAG TPA: sugar transferase [Gammaproteobacteria bacterium]
MLKRCTDVAVAGVALLLLAPLLLVVGALVKLDGGPALFVQERLGRGRRPFRIYKLRTMRDGAVTRLGRVLRATGVDELPQLVNVLRGDMSLIGPRPLTEADVVRLGWHGPSHAARWSVRPGITGLAQLHAGRGARQSWFLDARYVRDGDLGLDLAIAGLSVAVVALGKRRVRAWLREHRRRLAARRAASAVAASRAPAARPAPGSPPAASPTPRLAAAWPSRATPS